MNCNAKFDDLKKKKKNIERDILVSEIVLCIESFVMICSVIGMWFTWKSNNLYGELYELW